MSVDERNGRAVDRAAVERWIAGYEAAWRSPGTDMLAGLFAADATYLHSPYTEPVVGLGRIGEMWEEDRQGPDEVFAMSTEIVALDGDVAVVRALVRYGEPVRQEYTDLWIVRFDSAGRCAWFEEWPYWPKRPWSARDE
jgi:ketosteroid isomerase-like protein